MTALQTVLNRLDCVFLGVVEEVKYTRRKALQVTIDTSTYISDKETQEEKTFVDKVFSLPPQQTQGEQNFVDLMFTDMDTFNGMASAKEINVKTVIDSSLEKQRIVLQVQIGNSNFVLKCTPTKRKSIFTDQIRTPSQDEAENFDTMPDTLKPFFVKKFAHGRLWLGKVYYNCEVLLLEPLQPKSVEKIMRRMIQNTNNLFDIWAKAVNYLLIIHQQKYTHGDSSLSNMNVGLDGKLKFIDPERMQKLGKHFPYTQTLLKLCDIHHMLFHTFLWNDMFQINLSQNDDIWPALYNRLCVIHGSLSGAEKSLFLLHDVIIYCREIKYINLFTDKELETFVKSIKSKNEAQFLKLGNIDTDSFLLRLCDPMMLKATLEYLHVQINKATSSTCDNYDKNFPGSPTWQPQITPLPDVIQPEAPRQQQQNAIQPALPTQQQDATAGNNIIPLVLQQINKQGAYTNAGPLENLYTDNNEVYAYVRTGKGFQLYYERGGRGIVQSQTDLKAFKTNLGPKFLVFNGVQYPLQFYITDQHFLCIGYFIQGGWHIYKKLDLNTTPLYY
jgi:hypothetical protein